ncbi:helix-turn-helix domain-containing protein [Schaalia naturae]|jgi:hypothetical protein|uniref:Helix-turn-helix domain-containing protein n=1 Tax=Schaalia naturae TaxID=635203 RepID=A0ABW2SQ36_9ACTO
MNQTTVTSPTVDIFHPARHPIAELAPAWPSQRRPFHEGADGIARACDGDRETLLRMDRATGLRYFLQYAPGPEDDDVPEDDGTTDTPGEDPEPVGTTDPLAAGATRWAELVGARLRHEMTVRHMTVAVLARRTGIPAPTLRRRLSRPGALTIPELAALAGALRVTVTTLCTTPTEEEDR